MENKSRRFFMKAGGLALTGGLLLRPGAAHAAEGASGMDALSAIMTRRSVRAYTKKPVTDEQIEILLRAGMAAPSAGNQQPWEFVVIRDAETLAKAKEINKFAAMAEKAPLAILTCVNEERVRLEGYGILDLSACTQNILLAAHAIGLGAVWTGIYPQEERVQGFRELVGAPQSVVPLALVVVGNLRPQSAQSPVDRYDATRIHQEKW